MLKAWMGETLLPSYLYAATVQVFCLAALIFQSKDVVQEGPVRATHVANFFQCIRNMYGQL